METIQSIFGQLGIDSSFFLQFLITLIVFILARFVFLDKLLFVIQLRESKTSKMEMNAEKTLHEADVLAKKYQGLIETAHQKAQNKFSEKKMEILEKENAIYKNSEEEMDNYKDKMRADFDKEIQQKRSAVFSEVDAMAGLLINKISK